VSILATRAVDDELEDEECVGDERVAFLARPDGEDHAHHGERSTSPMLESPFRDHYLVPFREERVLDPDEANSRP
jgi:hypothetical protein